MRFKFLVISSLSIALLSACASDGQRKFTRGTELSSGVRALLRAEPDIGLNDPRIRCSRSSRTGSSRIGKQTCKTADEVESERGS